MKSLAAIIVVCLLMLGVIVWQLVASSADEAPPMETRPAPTPREWEEDAPATPLPSREGPGEGQSESAAPPPPPRRVDTNAAHPEAPATQPSADEPASKPAPRWPRDPATKDAERRLAAARDVLGDDPYHPQALRDELAALSELRRWQEACITLARLVELEPDNADLLFEQASTLMMLRRWVAAIPVWRAVLEREPENDRAWFNLAAAHQALGHLNEALRAWDRAIELSPSAAAHQRRGETLLDLQEWAAAAEDFARVLEQQPEAADATLNLALALCRMNRDDEARERLVDYLSRHPRHIPTLNRLAQMAGEKCHSTEPPDGAACEEAVEWCRRSLAIHPQQSEMRALLDSLQDSATQGVAEPPR